MPPKCKFTRAEIIAAALDIVRTQGADALTARSLGAQLGTSAKPVFGLFSSMQEVAEEVLAAADSLYRSYLHRDMTAGIYPPYKASGMAYIRFAREEKELFKLLFMRDRSSEIIVEDREAVRPMLDLLMRNLGISEDAAYMLHVQLWVYVHGIATMIATSYLDWDMELVSRCLTDAYKGFSHTGE